jgi:hypothetical protein
VERRNLNCQGPCEKTKEKPEYKDNTRTDQQKDNTTENEKRKFENNKPSQLNEGSLGKDNKQYDSKSEVKRRGITTIPRSILQTSPRRIMVLFRE